LKCDKAIVYEINDGMVINWSEVIEERIPANSLELLPQNNSIRFRSDGVQ
jgi:hypothetical protein